MTEIRSQEPDGKGRRRGRPPKSEAADTRELILDAALDLFARRGYAGASIRAIAQEVGISKSAICTHFGVKRAIYEAILEECVPPSMLQMLSKGEIADTEPAAFVRKLVGRAADSWDGLRARKTLSFILREGILEESSAEPGVRMDIIGATGEVQRRLGDVFSQWMDEGYIESDFSPQYLVWELFGSIACARILYLHGQASAERRREGRRLIKVHVEYFLCCVLKAHPELGSEAEDRTEEVGR